MAVGMVPDLATKRLHAQKHILTAGDAASQHKKRCADIVFLQHVQDVRCHIRVRPIVKRQSDQGPIFIYGGGRKHRFLPAIPVAQ